MRFLLSLALGLILSAQTATVVPLSPANAAEAKKLYGELQAAQKAWDAFRAKVEAIYLITTDPDRGGNTIWGEPSTGGDITGWGGTYTVHKCQVRVFAIGLDDSYDSSECIEWRKAHPSAPPPPTKYRLWGFENGFEFDKDFKFLVPKPPQQQKDPGITWTPLYTTPYVH